MYEANIVFGAGDSCIASERFSSRARALFWSRCNTALSLQRFYVFMIDDGKCFCYFYSPVIMSSWRWGIYFLNKRLHGAWPYDELRLKEFFRFLERLISLDISLINSFLGFSHMAWCCCFRDANPPWILQPGAFTVIQFSNSSFDN